MPVCSRCGVDQPAEAFSEESSPLCEHCYEVELQEEAAGGDLFGKEGLRQDMDQADDVQVEEEQGDDETPGKPVVLSSAARILNDHGELLTTEEDDDASPPDSGQLEDLIHAVESRGYSQGFGLDSPSVLRVRLQRVLFDRSNPVITWLTRPLVRALIQGPASPAVNVRVTPLNAKESVIERQSLLHWVSQWKLLQLQCGWRGHDDFVDLLIRAGANANAALQNGCTPLFFAVKYGSVDTVRLLIEGGADPSHRDCREQTCLRNALPQASPYILKYLLQHLNADETFVTEIYNGSKCRINALDIMVTEFVTPQPDVSWATLGMPSVDDYAQCLLLFLQKGVQISPYYPDVAYFLSEYLQGNITALKRSYYTRKIADLFFGQWLPVAVQDELSPEESTKVSGSCQLCQNNSRPQEAATSRLIQLYCGHSFCQNCILLHSQSAGHCPTCNLPLCQELRPGHPTLQSTNMVVANPKPMDEERKAKLSQLTLKQLQFECEARNLQITDQERKDYCVQALVEDWKDFTLPQGLAEEGDSGSRLMPELTLTNTMISEDNYLWVAPSLASVMIPIVVRGIPVFALLSTTSPYTLVSPRFVQQFGFQLISNLQVTLDTPLKFVRAEDDDQKAGSKHPVTNNPNLAPAPPKPITISAPQIHLTCVRDFCFRLGKSGIEVQLPSAVQACEPHTRDWPVGVILGMDFFQSAAWIQLSVEVDLEICLGRTVALLTGSSGQDGLDFDLIEPRRAKRVEEELRYYAKDGKLFWTPLWHTSLSKLDCCLSLGQYMQHLLPYPNKRRFGRPISEAPFPPQITECAWCCRKFPLVRKDKSRDLLNYVLSRPMCSGMIQGTLCNNKNHPAFYCDSNCRQQAMSMICVGHGQATELSSLKIKDSTEWKSKLYMLIAAIVVAAFLWNAMVTARQPLHTHLPAQGDIGHSVESFKRDL